jgi:outer membrane receptor protein involved in Fe transport
VAETSDLNVKKWTEELRLASASAQALEWQLGAFFTRESSTLDQTLPVFLIPSQAFAPLPAPLETAALDSLYREWSAFGEFTYHFSPAFDLALGGRWSENKQSANQEIGGLLVPPQTTSGDSSESKFTYSVAPRWHISQDTMAYARVASGYRPGGPNALPPGAPAGVPRNYESDSTVNYELGSRTTLLDHRLSIDVAAFLIDWSKIQLLQVVENFGINANGGKARTSASPARTSTPTSPKTPRRPAATTATTCPTPRSGAARWTGRIPGVPSVISMPLRARPGVTSGPGRTISPRPPK